MGFLVKFLATWCLSTMASTGSFSMLTRKHDIRVNVFHVWWRRLLWLWALNRAVVLFVEKVDRINRLVEEGMAVGGAFVSVVPLGQPAT